jgi:GT2 family glycosyltransferase
MTHTISAVVINFNGGQRILNTVASLFEQPYPLNSITVVDNGSTDGSPQQISRRFKNAHLIELGKNLGLPSARNAGLAKVSGDRVLLVDADLLFEADTIEQLDRAMTETKATVVCPRVRLHPERHIVQADGAEAHFIGTMTLRNGHRPFDSLDTRRATVGGCIGACMLLEKQAVLDAGGFDELFFFYFEDLEFMLRLRSRGLRFVCEPNAVVFHDRGKGTAGLSFRGNSGDSYPSRRVYFSTRHRWLAMLAHYRLRTLILLSPALAIHELASLGLIISRGWFRAWLGGLGWLLSHPREVMSRRRTSQQARTLPDRELLNAGPLPLAPGLLRSKVSATLVHGLSILLNCYWRLVRPIV